LGNPARPWDFDARFFRRRINVISCPLSARAEALSLLQDVVNKLLVAIVERVHRIIISPEGIAFVVGDQDAHTRVQDLESPQVTGNKKIYEETLAFGEAGKKKKKNVRLEAEVGTVQRMVVFLATARMNILRYPASRRNLIIIIYMKNSQLK
jgi:hypothetical protein